MKSRHRWISIAFVCFSATANAQPPPGQVRQLPPTEVGANAADAAKPTEETKATPTSIAEGARLMRSAQAAATAAERNAALEQAQEIYVRAVAADPKQGAALNNLAVLAVRKGESANARQYFERAIAADDGHKGFYALNYSKFLEATDKPAAIDAARVAVEAAPESQSANEQLASLLWEARPAELLPFANSLVARGNTELATRLALQCLQSQSRPPAERREWLVLLASRVANEYSISQEVRRSLSEDLSALESDPEIGRGSRQLRAVIGEPPRSAADVDWWRSQPESARAAMRAVLLSAGSFVAPRDWRPAEQYYRTAIDLGDRGPDPDAFVKLVELYANISGDEDSTRQGLARLSTLMNDYQGPLFSEKSDAYAGGNWPLIYKMHTALGMTYAYLDIWQSRVPFQNGIFQLSNAMRAAEEASRRQGGERRPLALPRVGVEQLARGYETIGRKDLAAKARVDGAAALQRSGYTADSKSLFGAVTDSEASALDAETRRKYDALSRTL